MFTLVSRVTRTLLADPSIASSDATAAGAAGSGGKNQLADVQRELNAFNTALPPQLRFETVSFRMYAEVGQGAAFALMHVSGAGTGVCSHAPGAADAAVGRGDCIARADAQQLWFHA